MARIRSIKPEFWRHPVISRLPDGVQLLALALLSMADDEGYFLADPAIVRGEVMPFRESLARIREDLASLSVVGWIDLWEHPEQGLIGVVVNWAKHQRIDHASKSKIRRYDIRETLASNSRDSRETLAPDQGSRIKEQGGEQGGVADPVFSEMESIMAIDKATAARVAAEPVKESWLDWRAQKRLGIPRTGEDGDLEAWKYLWKEYGKEIMDDMYAVLIQKIPASKKIWYPQAAEWLSDHYKKVE